MRKYSLLVCLMLLVSVLFISCKEEGFAPANLLVVNAAIATPITTGTTITPIGPAIDVRWDGAFVFPNIIYGAASVTTGTPLTTIGTQATPQIVVNANYAPVKSGGFGLNFGLTGSGGASGVTIYNRTTSFLPSRSYTALAFDFTPFYKTVIMEDDLSAPPPGKIKVRFVHAVPQAIFVALGVPRRDTIDVTAFGGAISNPLNNASVFSLRNFADGYSNNRLHQFAILDSGSYRFGIRVAGTPGTSQLTGSLGLFPGLTNPTPFRLIQGKIYTIVARLHPTGLAAPNNLQPGITIITHN